MSKRLIEELYKKAPKENIEDYLNKVIKSKRLSVLNSMQLYKRHRNVVKCIAKARV